MLVPRHEKRTVVADLLRKERSVHVLDDELTAADRSDWMLRVSIAVSWQIIFRLDECVTGHIAGGHIRCEAAEVPEKAGVVPLVDHSLQTERLRKVDVGKASMIWW